MNNKLFRKSCLFLLSALFLFNNAGFVPRELSLAAGLAFLAALCAVYLPLKTEKRNTVQAAAGIALMLAAVALMPLNEFVHPGAFALFLLAFWLLLKGLGRQAPELQLFSLTAAGYGIYLLLYRSNVHVFHT